MGYGKDGLLIILIDNRAGSFDLVQYFPPESCQLTRLTSGDAAFFGYGPDGPYTLPVGIELKSIGDILACFYTGRFLNGQLPGMTELYRRIYLVIYGDWRDGADGLLETLAWTDGKPTWVTMRPKTLYRAFDNWLNSITESTNVIVKRAITKKEAAAQIWDLYSFWSKDYEQHKSLFRFDKSHIPPTIKRPSLKRLILGLLPGVGWKKSGPADEHFKSIVELVMAEEDEWIKIPGIGKTLAKQIVTAFRESY